MTETPRIDNYTEYNARMEMSMLDKLFFLDKINAELIVDFGCANGALLKAIQQFNSKIKLIGYDNDPNMVGVSDIASGRQITDNWELIRGAVTGTNQTTLVLSSVLHEVCHYGSKLDIDVFWKQVFETGFDYIVIRDMIPGRSIDRPSHINDIKKIYSKFLGSKALTEFESIWGSVENNKQLIHFLLKYRYLEPNWEREVRENYMPVTREALLAKIPENYDVVFHEHYVLPYISQSVKDDVGIEIKDPTHLKLILRKR